MPGRDFCKPFGESGVLSPPLGAKVANAAARRLCNLGRAFKIFHTITSKKGAVLRGPCAYSALRILSAMGGVCLTSQAATSRLPPSRLVV